MCNIPSSNRRARYAHEDVVRRRLHWPTRAATSTQQGGAPPARGEQGGEDRAGTGLGDLRRGVADGGGHRLVAGAVPLGGALVLAGVRRCGARLGVHQHLQGRAEQQAHRFVLVRVVQRPSRVNRNPHLWDRRSADPRDPATASYLHHSRGLPPIVADAVGAARFAGSARAVGSGDGAHSHQ